MRMNNTLGGSALNDTKHTLNQTGQSQHQKSYGIPTIKLLNPELYKEMEKKGRQMKDPIF